MDETTELIKKIIEEHEQIYHQTQVTEKALNDLQAGASLEKAREGFMPGRPGDQKQSLLKLKEALETIYKGLEAHFYREEKGLLTSFEKKGYRTLATALRALLVEHEELRDRLDRAKQDVSELASGRASAEVWEGKAWGVRAYIGNTLKLLQAHAQSEQALFENLGKELK